MANLESLTRSLQAATSSFPSSATSLPSTQRNGISLFELKNDLFLSYLHHLSFLILCRIRGVRLSGDYSDVATTTTTTMGDNARVAEEDAQLGAEVVKKLAELRVWLEKGVRPCEGRLKYQIEKVLKAASDWERDEERRKAAAAKATAESDESGSSEESSDDEEDEEDVSEITSEDDEEEEGEQVEGYEPGLAVTTNYDSDDLSASINSKLKRKVKSISIGGQQSDLSFRPNPSMLMKDPNATASTSSTAAGAGAAPKDGIYRPPKITPVAMAPLPSANDDPDRRVRRERAQKSFAVEDFVESELSSAPLAVPSIGSTISELGRKTTTARERAKEAERREYEEANFVRLPKPSKKEMQAERRRQGGRSGGWGGEDWKGIEGNMNFDRIDRLTKRKKQDGMSGLLERSRKRVASDNFGGGSGGGEGGGAKIGERYMKKRKLLSRRR